MSHLREFTPPSWSQSDILCDWKIVNDVQENVNNEKVLGSLITGICPPFTTSISYFTRLENRKWRPKKRNLLAQRSYFTCLFFCVQLLPITTCLLIDGKIYSSHDFHVHWDQNFFFMKWLVCTAHLQRTLPPSSGI